LNSLDIGNRSKRSKHYLRKGGELRTHRRQLSKNNRLEEKRKGEWSPLHEEKAAKLKDLNGMNKERSKTRWDSLEVALRGVV